MDKWVSVKIVISLQKVVNAFVEQLRLSLGSEVDEKFKGLQMRLSTTDLAIDSLLEIHSLRQYMQRNERNFNIIVDLSIQLFQYNFKMAQN